MLVFSWRSFHYEQSDFVLFSCGTVSLKEPEFQIIKWELEESFHRAHEGRTLSVRVILSSLSVCTLSIELILLLHLLQFPSMVLVHVLIDSFIGENVSEKWKNVSIGFGFLEFDSVNTAVNVCMDLHNGCEVWKSKYDEETGMGFSLQVECYLNAQGLSNEFWHWLFIVHIFVFTSCFQRKVLNWHE